MNKLVGNSMAMILYLLLIMGFSFQSPGQSPAKVIFETDFSYDWDDVSAIAMLHALADMEEVEILGCMINTTNEYAGRACDAVNTFYGRPDIPIGVYKGSDDVQSNSLYTEALAKGFPNDLPDNDKVMEACLLYRKILASQPDSSVIILSVGFNDNLEALLKTMADEYSPLNGRELVRKKVKVLYSMGPYFEPYRFEPDDDNYKKGFNFHFHHESAKYVVDNWPTAIKFADGSLGHQMFIGNMLHQKPANSPVRRAFEIAEKTMDWNQHCADPSTIIYGVWDNAIFNEVTVGSCKVRAKDGWSKWVQNPDLDHYYNLPKLSIYEMEYLMNSLLLKDPRPDNHTEIIYPADKTIFYPGKEINAKGMGDNLRWTLKKGSGSVLKTGEGVRFDFLVPEKIDDGEMLVLTLKGDAGKVTKTFEVKLQGLAAKYFHRNFSKYYEKYRVDRKDYHWLNGAPHTFEQVDGPINFHWGNKSPDPLLENDSTFSVAWTGYIKPDFSDTYTLYLKSSEGARLFVDNELVIDDRETHQVGERSVTMSFEAGKYYPLKIEFYAENGDAAIVFLWSGSGQKKTIVPVKNLFITKPVTIK